MTPARLNLETLLAPVTSEDFFARYWEREPLAVSRGGAERYASLFTTDDLDRIITTAFKRQSSSVELLGQAEVTGSHAEVQAESVAGIYELQARGATVRVYNVQQFWKTVGALCRELEQFFNFPVRANLYSTPATAQGAQRHYDTHDVMVLQIAGRKEWRVYRPIFPLPLTHLPPLPFERRTGALRYLRGGPQKGRADIGEEDAGQPTHTFTLEAGDLLYLPRGLVHEARTLDKASVHLTLGIHVLTWLDLLSVALGQVSNRDERFRAALPPGFANETGAADSFKEQFAALLQAFARDANFRDAIEETATSFIKSRDALPDHEATRKAATRKAEATGKAEATDDAAASDGAGAATGEGASAATGAATGDGAHAYDGAQASGVAGASVESSADSFLKSAADEATRLELQTEVERRPGLLCRLVAEGAMVGLVSARSVLWMPRNFREALRFVARETIFRVEEIPGLSESGKLALARRLMQDGFLRLAARD